MIISIIWAAPLSTIFIHENNSIAYATKFLRILCIGGPFSAVAYTVISFFQAVGKPWRSLVLALLRKGVLDIPLMFIFFSISKMENNSIGPELIIWATPITDIICSFVAIALFYRYVKHNGKNHPFLATSANNG
ncbi:MAG: hypothetical protein IJU64_01085, partial [Bacilli bacterium]|nr:hypothetical protein [Bacilli bacterium]